MIKAPSVKQTAFSCPYCEALTTQHWFKAFAEYIEKSKEKDGLPFIQDDEFLKKVKNGKQLPLSDKIKTEWIKKCTKLMDGFPFLTSLKEAPYIRIEVENIFFSECYNCHKVSVWLRDILVYPKFESGLKPNKDLDGDILQDFNEAKEILATSPRGSSALARLCVQKICIKLGENGKKLNDDIANLVKKGLNPDIQKALDVVRVVGNNAVHPGELNKKDGFDTAKSILELVNLICEQMISIPNKLGKLYEAIPDGAKKDIEKRDNKKS